MVKHTPCPLRQCEDSEHVIIPLANSYVQGPTAYCNLIKSYLLCLGLRRVGGEGNEIVTCRMISTVELKVKIYTGTLVC